MKSSRSGFTIVEILVTLVVMAALVALGTYAVGTMLVQARDRERESDVKILANALEARYNTGNVVIMNNNGADGLPGSYPGVNEVFHIDGWTRTGWNPEIVTGGYRSRAYKGTTSATFTTPTGDGFGLVCSWACAPADDPTQLASTFSPNKDLYIYAPADAAGNVCCCGNCVRYTLYWRSEADGQIKSLKSKHR